MTLNGTSEPDLPERIGDKVAVAILTILAIFLAVGYLFPFV
jgi:hypothetical protein